MQSDFAPRALTRAVCFAALLFSTAASAEEYTGRTPPRLSLIEGQVSFWRAGGDEWEAAEVNLPLAPGDFLYTGPGSRLEIQIGARAFVRAAENTQIGLAEHEGQFYRVDVGSGRATLDLRDLQAGTQIEVESPHGKLSITDPGLYDVAVGEERVTFAARQGGRGIVVAGADSVDLRPGSQVVAAAGGAHLAQYEAAAPDDWERWNSERTDRVLAATSRAYVSEDVYGVRDLDDYGTWRDAPEYGRVWVPANVAPNWAPYTTGRWLWDAGYGWSWVDTAPWGWAPYHYGRWVYLNNYWGWAPGPIVVGPVYSPALVAFFGGPSIGVSVGIGVPFVSWVALGWGEPIFPWWGPSWYRSRACWNGWGGPTVINNIYVDRRKRHHANDVKRYSNQRRRDAVVAVRRDEFGRRSVRRQHLDDKDHQNLRPVRNGNPVEPREVGVKEPRQRTRPTRPDRQQMARSRAAGDLGAASSTEPGDPRNLRNAQRPERPRPERQASERLTASRQRPERPLPSRGAVEDGAGTSAPILRDRPARAARERPEMTRPTRPERPLPSRDPGSRAERPSSMSRSDVASPRSRPARPSSVGQPEMAASRPRPERPTRMGAPVQVPQVAPAPRAEAPAQQLERPRMEAPRIERPMAERPRPQVAPQREQPAAREYSAPQYRGFDSPSRAQPRMEMPQQQPRAEQRQPSANFGGRMADRGARAESRPQRAQR